MTRVHSAIVTSMGSAPITKERIFALLERRAEMYFPTSPSLHDLAKGRGGRGAFVSIANSLGDLVHDSNPTAAFQPLNIVESLDYEPAAKLVREYNPETHFVIIVGVSLSRKLRDRQEDDSILMAFQLHRDVCKITAWPSV